MGDAVLTAMILAFLALGIALWRRDRAIRARYAHSLLRDTLLAAQTLLELVAHLQRHRGMSVAYLSGDHGFELALIERQHAIEAIFPQLRTALRAESQQDTPCMSRSELDLLRYRWQCLLEQWRLLSPESSMERHSLIISMVMDRLSGLSAVRLEPLAGIHLRLGVIRNYGQRLPALAETLGQARAIGSGVAARRECSSAANIRLMFLMSRAESLLEQSHVAHGDGGPREKARNAIREMARVLRSGLLLEHGPHVAPEEYFRVATQAIDAVYAWIDVCGRQIAAAAALAASELEPLEPPATLRGREI